MSLIRQFILQDPEDPTRLGEFDNKFKIPVNINVEHHKIHEGLSFERHIDSADADVASLNVAFKTKAGTKLAHILFGFSASSAVLFEIIEGASWTQGSGTALDIFNLDRDAGNSEIILEDKNQAAFTASNQVIQDVTGIAGGVIFEKQYCYSEKKQAGDTRAGSHEWLFKPDTTYIVRITQTGGNCKQSIDLHWYEHTNG